MKKLCISGMCQKLSPHQHLSWKYIKPTVTSLGKGLVEHLLYF